MTAPAAPAIRFQDVVRAYGDRRAVDGVTLEIPQAAFTILLGPSGCGKTTLLKTVNRLLEPTSGQVIVNGVDNASVDPVALRRGIGYAIQQAGLFPHMTVAENVAVVPQLLGWPRDRIAARVDELLGLVHLDPGEHRERFPQQLSGGQQQRVGLARALAGDPAILLMDEPFGAVDAIERAHLQDEIASLHRRLRKTIVFVTHDVDEALSLGDAIVVLRDGRVEQTGTPFEILARPATPFVSALVDADDVLRRLSVVKVAEALEQGTGVSVASTIESTASLREALSRMVGADVEALGVSQDGAAVGVVSVRGILDAARRMAAESKA